MGAMEDGAQRRLVLCFDGTNNNLTGGRDDTNVVKLCRLLEASPRQLVYYDPGVGNPGAIPGVTWQDRLRGKLQRLWGLAFGQGIYENMAEAYLFLMREWKPGDRICVFGFSRGAFTARSLAGMVARFGILDRAMEGLVPTLLHLYFADPKQDEAKYQAIVSQLNTSFCTPEGARAEVWFVGVWDTVESVGSPLSRRRIRASGTIIGKRFRHVRHALALDEHRRSFQPRLYYVHPTHDYAAGGQSIDQRWFSGAHCDVGGGYADAEAALSDQSLLWMLEEAVAAQVQLRGGFLKDGKVDPQAVLESVRGPQAGQARQHRVHSEAFREVYWALAGLGVRDLSDAQGNPGDPPPKPPLPGPAPAGNLVPAGDPVPPGRRWWQVAAALLAGLAFWLLHGAAISGNTLLEGVSHPSDLQGIWRNFLQLAQANLALACWQLSWWLQGTDAVGQLGGLPHHPMWMVVLDVAFILSYGFLLALLLARGFARWAGLRHLAQPRPALLNALGWSGTLIVGADLAEDALMLLAFGAGWLEWILVQDFFALLMSAACAAKWLGVVPATALVVPGLFGRRRKPAAGPGPTKPAAA
jgi:uncharacterized protein (DUF2235 family)